MGRPSFGLVHQEVWIQVGTFEEVETSVKCCAGVSGVSNGVVVSAVSTYLPIRWTTFKVVEILNWLYAGYLNKSFDLLGFVVFFATGASMTAYSFVTLCDLPHKAVYVVFLHLWTCGQRSCLSFGCA